MENKYVGYIMLGISALLVIIVLLFQKALKQVVTMSCGEEHSIVCPMNITIDQQTYLALAIVGLLIVIAVILIFNKPREKIIIKTKTVHAKKKKIDKSKLDKDEKKVVNFLEKENGAIFQKTLMEKLEIGKVKTTRLLDKLEAKQIIERKRRGMNNIVVLKK
jgi:uncharacterized membrane protein